MESDDPLRVAARSAGGSFARRESAQADSRLAQYAPPEAIRSASIALRPYNPAQKAQVFGRLSVADLGDVPVTPVNAEKTVGQIAEHLEPIVRAGTRTLCLGGDNLVVLGKLRALAAVHGPVGVVLLDAHADAWDVHCGERVGNGVGVRLKPDPYAVSHPVFAPGTGTPETAGLSTREALGFVRALRGIRFAGYDVVEVSPPYDGPGQPTAVAAANVAFELLTLDVLAHLDGGA